MLLSGGLDSAVLAAVLKPSGRVRTLTVGMQGAPDLAAGREAAESLGLPWTGAVVDEERLAELWETLGPASRAATAPARAVLLALAAAVDAAPTAEVLCGQGADELFLGYAHFRGLARDAAGERADADLARLRTTDWPAAQATAERLGHRLVAPFLDEGFVAAAQRVPLGARLPDPVPKAWMRAWARGLGVPDATASRPKRALQYGTRIDAWLRRTLKEAPPV